MRRPSTPTLVIALVVVLGAVWAGIWVGTRKNGDANPAVAASTVVVDAATPTATATTAPGKPVLGLKVAANSGGAKRAADGYTRIGWPQTCEGAAGAAASYAQLGNSTAAPGAKRQTAEFVAVGNEPRVAQFRSSADELPGMTTKTTVATGGFRVTDCTTTSAAVTLFDCFRVIDGSETTVVCSSSRFEMSWINGDWKIIDHLRGVPGPEDRWPKQKPWPAELNGKVRKDLLRQAGLGWTEFTDAPA